MGGESPSAREQSAKSLGASCALQLVPAQPAVSASSADSL